jgi:hypothetical protein
MLSRMTRCLAAAGLSALAVATAGCGGGDGDDNGGTGPGPVVTSGFSISNGSDREAWYLYSRVCGTEDWGEDELGSANILYPGESVSWEEDAECYDLLALTSLNDSPRYQALYQGKNVASGATTAVSIASGDWSAVVDVRVASLRQASK